MARQCSYPTFVDLCYGHDVGLLRRDVEDTIIASIDVDCQALNGSIETEGNRVRHTRTSRPYLNSTLANVLDLAILCDVSRGYNGEILRDDIEPNQRTLSKTPMAPVPLI